ncbi:hypothetical protein [Vibrio ouci]|nr:hypothetical protein [Vibrio ouci]
MTGLRKLVQITLTIAVLTALVESISELVKATLNLVQLVLA